MNPDKIQTSSAGGRGDAERVRAVAAVHLSADRGSAVAWVVASDLPETGAGSGGAIRQGEQRRFSSAEFGAMRGWLRERGVGVVIRVAPSSQVLVRTVKLPEDVRDRAALAGAMELLAESELPAHLPWYRRTGGVISGASPVALVVGWHRPGGSHAAETDPLAAALEGVRQIWSSEAVALAWMLRDAAGDAPAWLASLDRAGGAAVLAMRAGGRLAVRALRVPADDDRRWAAAINAALAELARGLGDGVAAPTIGEAKLNGVLQGGSAVDSDVASPAAIPTALVEAFATGDPAVRALFNLHATEPRRSEGLAAATIGWLSHPVRAAAVVAACVGALLFVPLGVAAARSTTLKKQMAGVTGLDERLNEAEQRVSFYGLLREKRWPMSKLLADVAMCAPEGITLDVLEINQGEPISIRGVAKSNDLVSTFRENLIKTRVFESIATPNLGSTAEGVQFQVQAKLSPTGTTYRGNVIDDFAANPLGKRLYGDAWTAEDSGYTEPDVEPQVSLRSETRGTTEHSPRSAASRAEGESGSRGRSGEAAPAVPPPMSDDEITKLDQTRAMLEWAKRKKAATTAGIDPATAQRLRDESEKAKARMDELKDKKGGGS